MNLNRWSKKISYAGLTLLTAISNAATNNGAIKQVNTPAEFDKLLKKNNQVVVQFYNPTCPVCMAFKRKGIFAKAAKMLPDVTFAMTSSDQGATLHEKYKITAYPTFKFFVNGNPEPVGQYKGYVEAPQFINKVTVIFGTTELNKAKISSKIEQEKAK